MPVGSGIRWAMSELWDRAWILPVDFLFLLVKVEMVFYGV